MNSSSKVSGHNNAVAVRARISKHYDLSIQKSESLYLCEDSVPDSVKYNFSLVKGIWSRVSQVRREVKGGP